MKSSSKSTHSPATYRLSNDVSIWVAPAFIKPFDLIKAGATQTKTSLRNLEQVQAKKARGACITDIDWLSKARLKAADSQ